MTPDEFKAGRHLLGLSEWGCYLYLFGPPLEPPTPGCNPRKMAKNKIRQWERGTRTIPSWAKHSMFLLLAYARLTNDLPPFEDIRPLLEAAEPTSLEVA